MRTCQEPATTWVDAGDLRLGDRVGHRLEIVAISRMIGTRAWRIEVTGGFVWVVNFGLRIAKEAECPDDEQHR